MTRESRSETLSWYLKQARKHRLLSRDEEHELAIRWTEDGDQVAMRRLVAANLRLVAKIAFAYRRSGDAVLDLIQEGNVGLLRAVRKFDPHRGVRLSTYAAWWIRAYMLQFLLRTHRIAKCGTTPAERKLFFNLRKHAARLRSQGIEPTTERLAEELAVRPAEAAQMEAFLEGSDQTLDPPSEEHGGRRPQHLRAFAVAEDDPARELENKEFGLRVYGAIRTFTATLSARDAEVIRHRMLAERPLTLEELGTRWGVSREATRQAELRLRRPLRKYLRARMGDTVDAVLQAR